MDKCHISEYAFLFQEMNNISALQKDANFPNFIYSAFFHILLV